MDITILVGVCGEVEGGAGRSNDLSGGLKERGAGRSHDLPGGLKEGQNEREGRRCTEAKSG